MAHRRDDSTATLVPKQSRTNFKLPSAQEEPTSSDDERTKFTTQSTCQSPRYNPRTLSHQHSSSSMLMTHAGEEEFELFDPYEEQRRQIRPTHRRGDSSTTLSPRS